MHTATLLHDDVVNESSLRQRQRQRAVRQCRQRAGGRLPVLARLPDDGVGRRRGARGAGRRSQRRHRRARCCGC
ncbi:MAG: hypothetical protein U1F21_03420 [Sphaerotilus natans]